MNLLKINLIYQKVNNNNPFKNIIDCKNSKNTIDSLTKKKVFKN